MNDIFEVRGEPNYAAEVRQIGRLESREGLDNLMAVPWAGLQALVGKDHAPEDIMVFFPAEAQLSDKFLRENNLYRDTTLNEDPTQKGYLEKNGRVRAIRLRGVTSSALALPLSSLLRYTDTPPPVGTRFDTINGEEICRKYEKPVKAPTGAAATLPKWRRVDDTMLPRHFDTLNYWRERDRIGPYEHVVVTQKLHGTSVRIGRVPVRIKHSWKHRLARWFGIPVREYDVDVVGGSRKVIKDPNDPDQNHFYDHDIWSAAALKYGEAVPENVILYGELVGYVDNKPIQTGYTYNLPPGKYDLYVYRVSVVTPNGGLYDLSWAGVKEFCQERGLKHVPELWTGEHRNFDADKWVDARYHDDGFSNAVQLSRVNTVDEGVCVRAEGVIPTILKAKSPQFFEFETKLLDEGVEILS